MTPLELVTLTEVKDHLHILDTSHDSDLEMKIRAASAIVMRYIKLDAIPEEWIENHSPLVEEVPWDIHAATLLVVGELFLGREGSSGDPLTPSVKSLLWPYRKPSMA